MKNSVGNTILLCYNNNRKNIIERSGKMEGFDFYISSNGYLVIPSFNIQYKIDPIESNIPIMPESTENVVKIAGRDGDISLSTNYEPMSFTIVCYTDDNLTAEEKSTEKSKVSQFLDSIKKTTKTMAFQQDEKFYDVKYSGNLITTEYPKHIKFSIPLKSSNPYAKKTQKTTVAGASTAQTVASSTIKDVGVVITILGPATLPELAINNLEMIYTYNILEGAKVVIDTRNCTITNINSNNVKTNVMQYYNHQFPKIHSGNNELKVQSGINSPATQVTFEWYDLTL